MKLSAAVRHLRVVGDACDEDARLAALLEGERPLVQAAYAFGAVVEGAEQLDHSDVALVLDLPSAALPWGAEPREARAFISRHRIDKYPVRWYLRPRDRPIWNHLVRDPVRFWSAEGLDDEVLAALSERRLADLRHERPPSREALDLQLLEETALARAVLDRVVQDYWEPDWRRSHRGSGIHPEHHLWNAAWGYIDLQRGRLDLHGAS